MTITIHDTVEQGSDAWAALRCGRLCASEIKHIITPTLKIADNVYSRAHVLELAAQRITQYVEPTYISSDMLRGVEEEIDARVLYAKTYAPIQDVGFVTNDEFGFTIGCSPDGLVGEDGGVEFKSRRQRFQVQTISEMTVPEEFVLQIQTCLLVTRRKWWDFGSYCGGLPMVTMRVWPDEKVQASIVEAARIFEANIRLRMKDYAEQLASPARLVPTERKIIEEMYV